jgi:hypothetical protein
LIQTRQVAARLLQLASVKFVTFADSKSTILGESPLQSKFCGLGFAPDQRGADDMPITKTELHNRFGRKPDKNRERRLSRFELGIRAQQAGLSKSDNPFPEGTAAEWDWSDGWRSANSAGA